MNQCAFKHSARNLPVNDSMKALSVGLPGLEKSSVTPRWYAHRSKSRDTNSEPWSTRMTAGNPTARPTLSSTSTTSAPRKSNRGSIAGEKRENVSTIVSTRSFVPVASWSCTKSIAQVSFDRVAGRRCSRSLALTRRLGVLWRNCRPISRYSRYTRLAFTRQPSRRSSTWIRRYP